MGGEAALYEVVTVCGQGNYAVLKSSKILISARVRNLVGKMSAEVNRLRSRVSTCKYVVAKTIYT